MRLSRLASVPTLSIVLLGLVALTPAPGWAGPDDADEVLERGALLRLGMFDHFHGGRDLFFPRGLEVARLAHEARDARHAARLGEPGGIDLSTAPGPIAGGISTTVNPIPEPSSVLLFAAGFGIVAWVARRKLT